MYSNFWARTQATWFNGKVSPALITWLNGWCPEISSNLSYSMILWVNVLKSPTRIFYRCVKLVSITEGCSVENFNHRVSPKKNLQVLLMANSTNCLNILLSALLSHGHRLRSTKDLYSDRGYKESHTNAVPTYISEEKDRTWDCRHLHGDSMVFLRYLWGLLPLFYLTAQGSSHINTKTTSLLLQYSLLFCFYICMHFLMKKILRDNFIAWNTICGTIVTKCEIPI